MAKFLGLPPALSSYASQPIWLLWKAEFRPAQNKWTKVPYCAQDPGCKAATNDPATWAAFDVAEAALAGGHGDGIGLALRDTDLGAFDLDHCRDPANGDLQADARHLVDQADSYTEISPSDTGLRILLRATGPKLHRRQPVPHSNGMVIETYRRCERYITVTGDALPGVPDHLADGDLLLEQTVAQLSAAKRGKGAKTGTNAGLGLGAASRRQQKLDLNEVIKHGEGGHFGGDRSAAVWWVINELLRRGRADSDILAVLLDHTNRISEHVYDQSDPHAYARRQITRAHAQAQAQATGASVSTGTTLPQQPATRRAIEVKGGNTSEILDAVERELVERYGGFGLYQRGGQLVHVTRFEAADADGRATLVWRLAPVEHAHVFEVFTRIIDFQKFDGRRKGLVSVDCPMQLPIMYAARRRWDLPTVLGIVHTPQLRADGSLVETEGYDPETRLLFKFNGEVFPPVPAYPTKADADAALRLIEETISTFPFKTKVDLSVVLSMFLTVLSQRSYGLAPLHGISAPAAGTGKSLLVALAAILASGQTAPVIAQGLDKNEFRKTFASELLSGVPLIAIDNCEQPLTGDLLCQAITEENKNIRLFGHLKAAGVGTGTLITATGNNLMVGSDLWRRVLTSTIDAQVERPEKRKFKVRIKRLFRERRGELVSALLTVLRAGRLAQAEIERLKLEPLGGFEGWCAWVRDPLVWLGRADPKLSIEAGYENNIDREVRHAAIHGWNDNIGLGVLSSVQEVIDQTDMRGQLGTYLYPTLREALLQVAEDHRSPGNLSAKRLGWWLRQVNGQPIDGMRLVKVKVPPSGHSRWMLETI